MPREYISAEEWERQAEGEERMPSKDNGPVTERSGDETAALLREVLANQKRILETQVDHGKMLMRIGLRLKSIDEQLAKAPLNAGPSAQKQKATATQNELNSERGNPIVKNDPKGWQGESYRGQRYSECPAEYLDKMAEQLDKFAWFNEKDAAKARGWAERNRKNPSARQSATEATPASSATDNEWG